MSYGRRRVEGDEAFFGSLSLQVRLPMVRWHLETTLRIKLTRCRSEHAHLPGALAVNYTYGLP